MGNYQANGDFGGQSKVLKGGAIGSPHCIEHKVHSAFLGNIAIRVEWDGIRWNTIETDVCAQLSLCFDCCICCIGYLSMQRERLYRLVLSPHFSVSSLNTRLKDIFVLILNKEMFSLSFPKKNFSQTLEFFWRNKEFFFVENIRRDQQNISFSKILVRIGFWNLCCCLQSWD